MLLERNSPDPVSPIRTNIWFGSTVPRISWHLMIECKDLFEMESWYNDENFLTGKSSDKVCFTSGLSPSGSKYWNELCNLSNRTACSAWSIVVGSSSIFADNSWIFFGNIFVSRNDCSMDWWHYSFIICKYIWRYNEIQFSVFIRWSTKSMVVVGSCYNCVIALHRLHVIYCHLHTYIHQKDVDQDNHLGQKQHRFWRI